MKKGSVLAMALLLFGFCGPAGQVPPSLLDAVRDLEGILADHVLASGWVPGWGPYEFARFTAGRLSSQGYSVRLARADEDWWVVVFFHTAEDSTVIPVIPGYPPTQPTAIRRGIVLGDLAGSWEGTKFEITDSYLDWDELVPLPPNQAPKAAIKVQRHQIWVGDLIRLLGVFSYDPDGTIVRYVWEFGDGKRAFGMNVTHRYELPGRYTVTLTVIDDGGLVGSTSMEVLVVSEGDETGDSGCGCGG